MMAEFIFLLTRHDKTVPDALAVYEEIRSTGVRHVGFKDVGAPLGVLRELVRQIKSDGRTAYLEVVSVTARDELRSIEAGVGLGVDVIMGGTHPNEAEDILRGSDALYYPFPGRVVDHPSVLVGSVEEIALSASDLTARPYVHGLDLLAYRYGGDVPALISAVVGAAAGPVVAAGSIESPERIRKVGELGCWGFTIGGAVFERRLVPDGDLSDQIERALLVAAAPVSA
jgi:hypothetical protein